MTGTLINTAAVLVGGGAGLLLGGRMPERVRDTVFKGLGLLTLVIGMRMALQTQNILILMGSILLGGILGELLDLQGRLDRIGDGLQKRMGSSRGRFSEGFVTASLVFCVGPMTVMGTIQDGMSGDYELLAMKSTLDGFAALGFAAAMGPGVLFSALTVLVGQGALTLGSGIVAGALTDVMTAEMTATGGLIILGIGCILLDIARPRAANFLPALFIAPLIVKLVGMI